MFSMSNPQNTPGASNPYWDHPARGSTAQKKPLVKHPAQERTATRFVITADPSGFVITMNRSTLTATNKYNWVSPKKYTINPDNTQISSLKAHLPMNAEITAKGHPKIIIQRSATQRPITKIFVAERRCFDLKNV